MTSYRWPDPNHRRHEIAAPLWRARYWVPARVRTRYPRLLRAMQWVACLSESEAVHALQARLVHGPGAMCHGDAVSHYLQGEPVDVLIHRAWVMRHYAREYAKPTTEGCDDEYPELCDDCWAEKEDGPDA